MYVRVLNCCGDPKGWGDENAGLCVLPGAVDVVIGMLGGVVVGGGGGAVFDGVVVAGW
jgi:hypothetical protein